MCSFYAKYGYSVLKNDQQKYPRSNRSFEMKKMNGNSVRVKYIARLMTIIGTWLRYPQLYSTESRDMHKYEYTLPAVSSFTNENLVLTNCL